MKIDDCIYPDCQIGTAHGKAVEVSSCDHDLIEIPTKSRKLRAWYCQKCEAGIWESVDASPRL